jgi:hypothetical protein
MPKRSLFEPERILREQQITETEPGPILHDFEAFLDFIASQQIVTTSKFHLLPMDRLAALNAQMARPIEIGLKRPQQKSYPHLHGLFLLARTTGLMRAQRLKQGSLLALDAATMASWNELNPAERYFALLEAWWLRVSMEIVGEHSGWMTGMQSHCLMLLREIPEEGRQIDKGWETSLSYWGMYNLALIEMFGLLQIERGEPQKNKGWIIAGIEHTDFGRALVHLVSNWVSPRELLQRLEQEERDDASRGGKAVFDAYRKLVQPYFPEWQKSLTLPTEDVHRDGVFTFNVSLGKLWRRIAIPAELTLDDLSLAILDAYEFDNDHLHRFTYQNRFGRFVRIYHHEMHESSCSNETLVGRLPLHPGDVMEYLFDFGDEWRFDVLLEKVDPPNPGMEVPELIESHGKAPPQYPSWDEEWEEEDDEE